MEIILTNEEAENIFYTALCNGLSQLTHYGLELTYDPQHYKEAKEQIKQFESNNTVCYEDVLMGILKSGHPLTLVDNEGDEEKIEFRMSEVYEGIKKVPHNTILEMVNEEDDADTADLVLQYVILGEHTYG
jgi:hypothetical protein